MVFRNVLVSLMVAGVAAIAAGLGGCSQASKRYDVEVTRDEGLRNQTIEVDLIGANNPDTTRDLSTCPIGGPNGYFAADPKLRKTHNPLEMKFEAGSKESTRKLSASDPKWEAWQSPTSLVIMAYIPSVEGDNGVNDPRRKVLPLASDVWGDQMLRIQITDTGLKVLTPVKKPY